MRKKKNTILIKLPIAIKFGDHEFFPSDAELVYSNKRFGFPSNKKDLIYTADDHDNLSHAFFNQDTEEVRVHVHTSVPKLRALLKKAESRAKKFKNTHGFFLNFGNLSFFFPQKLRSAKCK